MGDPQEPYMTSRTDLFDTDLFDTGLFDTDLLAADALEMWLEADAAAAGVARSIASDLARGLPHSVRDDALLVTSELVANAVEHGSGDRVLLRVRTMESENGSDREVRALEVAVRNEIDGPDHRLPPEPWHMPGPAAARGRGLAIVANLTTRVRVCTEGTSSAVLVSALVGS